MLNFNIQPVKKELAAEINHKIDFKTKPAGALGDLEQIALKVSMIQETLSPELTKPHLVVFAADHGIAQSGVSKYPQEVTYQMVLNFVQGGAAINVFSRQHGISLKVVDAGVKGDFNGMPAVIDQKIAHGTENFAEQPAMTLEQAELALLKGAELVAQIAESGCNVIGFGEMGIANTSSAAVIMHKVMGIPLDGCVGRGTGLSDEQLDGKIKILQHAVEKYTVSSPMEVLRTFGGFEIAQMTGAMLKAAEMKMIILIDGFIATSALLIAQALVHEVRDYCLFCHQSDESGHRLMLDYLNAQPILKLNMRLGEGTGAALAYPIIQSAVNFLNEMASFESAGVSNSTP
ncbi:nicotinate-nucleotide--dimethylbenzimidazole phosphoribosyltransferase [Solitalea sp. MAHUQ-68]|uniref:Nicotinate-nucleotide--dimethylbenzimidazole phosphoribosyltransferase n=1 Tax=Solitalea agri TaxID=2953739 RepID=A0A9X2JCT6_9SPHI|nr:nicotinate-nucleotide--dimethylbenzimidazole phosphoribosyltransferase [Solitalea agri]MCO4293827.1 nicotinate-nucleotide--dimethylbenzimidazole phosphoribosyltransferase [Solitalea agri]